MLLAVLVLLGSPPSREGRAEEAGVLVAVRDLEGARVEGRLLTSGPEGVTLRAAGGERPVPWASLVRLDVLEHGDRAAARGPVLRAHLVGGERIQGRFAKPSPDGLVLSTTDAGAVTIRFDALSSLATLAPDASACSEPEARFAPADGNDVAYVLSGDATTGLLLRAETGGLVLEDARGQEREVAWDDLAVLHLENDAVEPGEAAVVELETVGGDRLLAARPPRLENDALVFGLLSDPGVEVRVPLERTLRIRAFGKAYVFASDLPFTSTFETPYPTAEDDPTRTFLDAWYGARVNRRPDGCALRLHGTSYEHGFAVHARSRVVVPIGRAFRSFRALVGIDDVALAEQGGGLVDARVLGDDKVLWEATDLRAGEAPREVGPLDVSAVDELVLEVDFGQDGLHVRDDATWADPILVRK